MKRGSALQTTRSTCCYCGVGCGVLIEHDGQQVLGVRGDPDHPANFGRLCTKGQTLHFTASPAIQQHQRLRQPRLHGQTVAWNTALDHAAERLHAIATAHGPDALGFYVSGQLLTEDYVVFNKLAKGLFGTNNIDTNSRLCMSSAVAGYKRTLGADAPPACYEDVDHADLLFFAGSNAAWAHPVLFRRIEAARAARPSMRAIAVDPRRTETTEQADLHLALQPGSDVALFNGLLHLLLSSGAVDRRYIGAHTRGFAELEAVIQGCTPVETTRITGVAEADLRTAARWWTEAGAVLSLYCQGLNQSSAGTDKNAALINLHLATAQIGRPGAGPFSLTGQPNAMGGREVGGLSHLLPGHREVANAEHRAEVARLWGVPSLPAQPGKSAVELFQAAADGEVKALWIACTNPAQSLPDQATVRRALQRAEFVIVQEAMEDTATARFAHLLLPASSWAEKEGTVTNSERRISRVRAAVPPPGEARADWAIAADVARRVEGLRGRGARTDGSSAFDWPHAEAVWLEHRESTGGRDLDITGLDWARLDEAPQQWPFPEGAQQGHERLYADGRFPTPDGRARFSAAAWRAPAEAPSEAYPLLLNTGRLRDQWHGQSRTGLLGRLQSHTPEPRVHVHPDDLAAAGLRADDIAELRSARGTMTLGVQADAGLRRGDVYVPMHWGDEVLLAGINEVTSPARCPSSQQPELKLAAVSLRPAALRWHLLAARWYRDETEALQARRALRQAAEAFDHAHVLPFGRERFGLVLRAACRSAWTVEALTAWCAEHGFAPDSAATLDDPQRQQHRRLWASTTASGRQLEGCLIAGPHLDEAAWLLPLLQEATPLEGPLWPWLRGGAQAPGKAQATAPQVCTCCDVREDRIVHFLGQNGGEPGARMAALQNALRCGTQCGSCLPRLKGLIQGTPCVAPITETVSTAAG